MEWISVKDRLPEMGQLCVITDGKYFIAAIYTKYPIFGEGLHTSVDDWESYICLCCDDVNRITHWMPLPQLPK